MRLTSAHVPFALAAVAALAGCTPPQPIPVSLAETQCVQQVLSGTSTPNSSVTVGFGTGYGGWGGPGYYGPGWGGGWGGSGVAISTAVPVNVNPPQNPAQQYNNCVIRKSGQPPITPFAKRPELKG